MSGQPHRPVRCSAAYHVGVPGRVVAPRPTCGSLRWARGSCVGLAATGLAGAGHALAGGLLPGAGHLGTLLAGSVVTAVALSGRRWQLPSLLSVLLGAQVVLHYGFAHGAHHAHGSPAAMVSAHVTAALLTSLLLRRGEDWCWSLVDLLTRAWRTVRLLLPPVPAPRRTGCPTTVTPSVEDRLSACLPRRGPPAPVAA